MTEDIQDLVDRPRETLSIEVKGHLNLKDGVHQANLARHICALANFGGGYVVFGFDDKNYGPIELPTDLTNHYHRDTVSSIVATYLTPALLCDVIYVSAANGRMHPVIRVPSHSTAPVCAKKNGPHDANNKPQGIVSPLVYTRKVGSNGPESVAISSAEDWNPIIRRCVTADRTALLGLVESVLRGGQLKAAPETDPLQLWHDAAHRKYLALVAEKQPQWKTSIAANHYQLSYMIISGTPHRLPFRELLDLAEQLNTKVREMVWTGWSMFYPFSRPEIRPYSIVDESSGEGQHEILEASLLGDTASDTTLPDFWRLSTAGKASLVRAYREDRGNYEGTDLKPGEWFRPFFLARETAEVVSHASAMAQQFPAAESVAFRLEWFGLDGRRIADPEADWRRERIARTDRRLYVGQWPVADLASHWPGVVSEVASSVTRLFDPELELNPDWVRSVAHKFRSL